MQPLLASSLLRILSVAAYVMAFPGTYCLSADLEDAQSPASDGKTTSSTYAMQVQDPQARKIVQTIESHLAPIKGFTAQAETCNLSPNGGFERFKEEISLRRPDKMYIKRTVLAAHNADANGQVITIVIDGTWSHARIDRPAQPTEQRKLMEAAIRKELDSPEATKRTDKEKEEFVTQTMEFTERPSCSKTNLKAVEQAGGLSVREYLSGMHNLLDPFAQYDLKTLKLKKETPDEWVLTVEDKKKGPDWPENRLIIDKKTGFLKKVEIDLTEPARTVVLLDVKSITTQESLPDSIFQMEIPKSVNVIDNTDQYLMDIKEQKEMK